MKVPILDLKSEYAELRDEILAALDRVCQKSAFVLGEEVEAFEREFADFCGTKHCVALANGTAALHVGLLALGVQADHEVITTPNTFLATAEAIYLLRRAPGARGHRPGHGKHRSEAARARHHAAHSRDSAGASLWAAGGHGCHPGGCGAPQAAHSGRCRAGARRALSRTARRGQLATPRLSVFIPRKIWALMEKAAR